MKVSNFVSPRHNASGAQPVIDSFRVNEVAISSVHHRLNAFEVLMAVSPQLRLSGFSTAFTEGLKSKKSLEMRADDPQRSLVCKFDAVNWNSQTALVIHAGRGLTNNDYLKSLLHGSLSIEVRHLVIAVRNIYRTSEDFEKVNSFLGVLMASANTTFDLDSVTLIGY